MRLWSHQPRARPGYKYSLQQHGPRHWTWSHWSRCCPGGNVFCLSQGYLAADESLYVDRIAFKRILYNVLYLVCQSE